MSVEREEGSTPDNAQNILKIIEDMKKHNEVSVFMFDNEDRSKDLSEEEDKKRSVNFHRIGDRIVEIKASNLSELKLKAQAICSLISMYNDQTYVSEHINTDCDTYEAAAFSVVRDLLEFVH